MSEKTTGFAERSVRPICVSWLGGGGGLADAIVAPAEPGAQDQGVALLRELQNLGEIRFHQLGGDLHRLGEKLLLRRAGERLLAELDDRLVLAGAERQLPPRCA